MSAMERFMREAVEEARASLREGNHGFGAVVVKDGSVIARAHDREESERDPTSHAEMNAIRLASRALGKNLTGCALVSTHEPCPMCAAAVAWSGIRRVAYGYSIAESIAQGRARIDLPCGEMFARAGKDITVEKGILRDECALLYREDVRREVGRLRNATVEDLASHDEESRERKLQWFDSGKGGFASPGDDPLEAAYRLLLNRFGIDPSQAPVAERSAGRIVFRSMNFCPTLEACVILGLDTRHVCRHSNTKSTDALVKRIDPRLRFDRNYERLRPSSEYCEEMITLVKE